MLYLEVKATQMNSVKGKIIKKMCDFDQYEIFTVQH